MKRIGQAPKGFWFKNSHHRQFFDWPGSQLGYKEMDNWYNITQGAMNTHEKELWRYLKLWFNSSPSQALQTVYPEHDWMPWKFERAPQGFWEKLENHRQFFDWSGTQLGYNALETFYSTRNLNPSLKKKQKS